MDIHSQIITSIIKEQENIIGPVAIEQAQKVPGLTVDMANNQVQITGDKKNVIDTLIKKYRDLFGLASVQVCKDAAKAFIGQLPKDQVPPLLLS